MLELLLFKDQFMWFSGVISVFIFIFILLLLFWFIFKVTPILKLFIYYFYDRNVKKIGKSTPKPNIYWLFKFFLNFLT